MNRIKDFFYDKNDIIVALIILAAAAFIIYVRIGDIMSYPQTLVDATAQPSSAAESSSESSAAETAAPTEATTAPATQATTVPATEATTAPSAAQTKSITIADSAVPATVSRQLADAGIVSSADSFESDLQKYSAASHIRPGTFQIPAGATNEQIIEIITDQNVN